MKLFLFIIFLILFVPIPIKIHILFSKENYYIKIYNLSLIKKEKKAKKSSNKVKPEQKDNNAENKTKNAKNTFLNGLSIDKVLTIIKEFKKSTFKPSLKIHGYFNYSIGDAAKTAILYGILSTYSPLLSWFFSIIFKIKKFGFNINPIFKDEIIAEIKLTSIITLSIAQIIYMGILFIKVILFIKEDELKGGKI
ncbi:DUF2953 domain-containing protein [Clostridium cibarium]|uniref:DUF2953 domain-containing protein n=1 Tax=Clostridium cibarium TaxID=2762247 RepID=A0ABR8PPA0_9CLOT|nr:DUF2953 domain-containing protein [Clostridium cibarium]MBD7909990.1 DUF2953 domain-containing protein [Clostridium cibarium]